MKFRDYLDSDVKEFTELKIGLVDKKTKTESEVVQKIQTNFDLGTDLIKLIKDLNEKLGNTYHGKFKFDYVLQDNSSIDKLKINKNRKEGLKKQWLRSCGMLARKQNEVEQLQGDKD